MERLSAFVGVDNGHLNIPVLLESGLVLRLHIAEHFCFKDIVLRLHSFVQNVFRLHGAPRNVGLHIDISGYAPWFQLHQFFHGLFSTGIVRDSERGTIFALPDCGSLNWMMVVEFGSISAADDVYVSSRRGLLSEPVGVCYR